MKRPAQPKTLLENPGWMLAAIVPPFDATQCSGLAPCGLGPPGCFAAMMSLIGPSGDAAATLVLLGGFARCGPSPFFQSSMMRLPAAMLAAGVGPLGSSVNVDIGEMGLAAVVDLLSVSSEKWKECSSCSLNSSCSKGRKGFFLIEEISGEKDKFPKFDQSGSGCLTAGAFSNVLLDCSQNLDLASWVLGAA